MFPTDDYCFYLLETFTRPLAGSDPERLPSPVFSQRSALPFQPSPPRYLLDRGPGARGDVGVWRENGEAHVDGLGGDALGDAAAQINADILPVCAEWKLRNGVCVGFGSVYFLSQRLSTYQAAVIPNLPLYLTSSPLPSLLSFSCMSPSLQLCGLASF